MAAVRLAPRFCDSVYSSMAGCGACGSTERKQGKGKDKETHVQEWLIHRGRDEGLEREPAAEVNAVNRVLKPVPFFVESRDIALRTSSVVVWAVRMSVTPMREGKRMHVEVQ